MPRRSHPLLAGLLFGAAGCSLVVETADIDRGCASDEKVCLGRCVRIDDPAYGCNPDHCEPCELNNAIPTCSATGSCLVSACLFGFGCPDEAGCSINLLADSANCGTCTTQCAADQSCQNGVCAALE